MVDEITIKRNELVTLLEIKKAALENRIDDLQIEMDDIHEEISQVDKMIDALD